MPRIASCRLVGTQRRAVLLGALLPFMPLFAARAGVTESHKLTASDELPGDRFGAAVALDGDLAVVGMPAAAAQSGAAYVYRFDGSSWIEEAKLTAADADPGDEFGRAVAVDGDRLVIGAPFDSEVAILAGAAYLFQFDGQTWTQQAKIVAPDGAAADQFGHAVSIDGPSILVGAPRRDDETRGTSNQGSVYVFASDRGILTHEDTLTALDGRLNDQFGFALAVDGDLAAIGAHLDDTAGVDAGSVYMYRWNGAIWEAETELLAPDAARDARFGESVSVRGSRVVVGAPFADGGGASVGAAYLYERSDRQWRLEATLASPAPVDFQLFGSSVAQGEAVTAVGAPFGAVYFDDNGTVFLFYEVDGQWTGAGRLLASDGQGDGQFGSAVALCGDQILTGAKADGELGDLAGAAYLHSIPPFVDCNDNGVIDLCDLYDRTSFDCNENGILDSCDIAEGFSEDCNDNGSPDDCGAHPFLRLTAPSPFPAFDDFGQAVAIDGPWAAMSAPGIPSSGAIRGEVYVYREQSGTWSQDATFVIDSSTGLGRSLSIEGDVLVCGASNNAAYVFRYDGSEWTQEATLTAPPGIIQYGSLVRNSGDLAVVGARFSGTLYVFIYRFDRSTWNEEAVITLNDIAASAFDVQCDATGAMGGDAVAIGGVLEDGQEAVLVYRFSGQAWSQEAVLTASDGETGDRFGCSVSIDAPWLAIGAPERDEGAIYLFEQTAGGWVEHATVIARDMHPGTRLGATVDLAANLLVAGATSGIADLADAVYFFAWTGSNWIQRDTVGPVDPFNSSLGEAVAISGTVALAGDRSDSTAGNDAGSVQFYEVGDLLDCNDNGVPDSCEIADGTSVDANGNGLPDTCELLAGDVNGDLAVDVLDLIAVVGGWGPCPTAPAACAADLDHNGTVDVSDLLAVILNWRG